MTEFNPKVAIDILDHAAQKADALSKKWSQKTATNNKNAVVNFMSENRKFFEKTATVMGVLSAGCSLADSFDLFGEKDQQKAMDKMDQIENKIDSLAKEMNTRFDTLAAQVDYNTATAILAGSEADIRTQISHRDRYLAELLSDRSRDIEDARDKLLESHDTLDKDITTFYLAFTKPDQATNILLATVDYFAGAPEPLLTKAYDYLYLVQEAVKVIGLKTRIRKQLKEGAGFDLKQCVESINKEFEFNYKDKIEAMLSAIEKQIMICFDNMDTNVPKFYEMWLKRKLIKNPTNRSNPSMLCSRFSDNFPMLNFMAIEYANCHGDEEHVDGLRTSRAITDYHQKEIDRNLVIWWQWVPDPEKYSPQALKDKATHIQLNEKGPMHTLANMPEYITKKGLKTKNKNINDIIKEKTSTSLYYYSAGSQALVVRHSNAGRIDWAHSPNCSPRALVLLGKGLYDVFWMILDE